MLSRWCWRVSVLPVVAREGLRCCIVGEGIYGLPKAVRSDLSPIRHSSSRLFISSLAIKAWSTGFHGDLVLLIFLWVDPLSPDFRHYRLKLTVLRFSKAVLGKAVEVSVVCIKDRSATSDIRRYH